MNFFSLFPIGRNLQNRRSAHSAMRKENILAEFFLPHRTSASIEMPLSSLQSEPSVPEKHKGTSPGRGSMMDKPNCCAIRCPKFVAPSFGIDNPPVARTRDFEVKILTAGCYKKVLFLFYCIGFNTGSYFNMRRTAFLQQHGNNLSGTSIAKQLTQLPLVVLNPVTFYKLNKILRCISHKRRSAEVHVP